MDVPVRVRGRPHERSVLRLPILLPHELFHYLAVACLYISVDAMLIVPDPRKRKTKFLERSDEPSFQKLT